MNPVMRRLMREYKELSQHPVREFRAMPLEDNMFEWHFTIQGPPDSPYADGLYHGRVLVPTNYPFAPPDVVLITPNGRFELEKKICLSISSYHPENWRSNWGVSTVLHALRQFMLTPGNSGIGAIEYPVETRKAMAKDSREYKCAQCGRACKDDWDIMLASPLATEMDMNATVPPTPMMTPQNSMGSPQGSFNPTNSNNGSGSPQQLQQKSPQSGVANSANVNNNAGSSTSFPATPSHKPSAVASESLNGNNGDDDDLAVLTRNRNQMMANNSNSSPTSLMPPTISPLTVGKPVIDGSQNPTPQSSLPAQQRQQSSDASPSNDSTNNMQRESSVAVMATPQASTSSSTVVADENKKFTPPTAPVDGPPQQHQQPAPALTPLEQQNQHLPPGFNLPPPRAGGVPGNHRAAALRRNHIQQRNNVPFIRRDANGRFEVNFSLAVLDKLVTFAAVLLACLTAYKMAVLFADPETVAGRIFDSVVSLGLDLVE